MSNLPKGVDQLPKGIQIHGNQIRIDFRYRGERCREALEQVARITKSSISYAQNKRNVILTEIKEGRFDYAAHFPNSPKAHLYSGYGGDVTRRTVEEGTTKWLEVQKAKRAHSTYKNYKHKADYVSKKWGSRRIAEIPKSDIELFQSELLAQGLKPKTVNDIFTAVRGIWSDAFQDGVIKHNPLDRIQNLERDDDDEGSADPFSREELDRLANILTNRPMDINMFMFTAWSGLSLSEVMALAWEDIDTETWTLKVQRARVYTQYKVPKERSRVRVVELIDPAIDWLKRQEPFTKMLPPQEVEVIQRNNVTTRKDEVRFVFLNAPDRAPEKISDSTPWYVSSLVRRHRSALQKAKLRARGANQYRHTFASQLLSNYIPLEWVARQLGHADTTMVKRHYGCWIPNDTRSMAGMISQMMGFRKDSGGQETGDLVPKWSQGGN
ncbi:integrase [Marinobacterium nitratireducens]|uniref:Integrase n=1 Tax=Marinobacterium nitratireducens TaxID=518897 RepID=A0A917ZDZ6_9GAMM|nr:DUF3596 domain-containing protein [Marinobacterium nitratireducens]GGO80094.1 integrase [Marinobacterium nitratireducens]